MGLWIAATCDREEECQSPAWYGDDFRLAEDDEDADRPRVVGETAEYLTEYEEWAVVDGKLLCPKCKPKETEETP